MKVGIYPGSFNPFHVGHYNIAVKAESLFDKLIVLQLHNPDKEAPTPIDDFNIPLNIKTYDGNLIDFYTDKIHTYPENEYFIVRGLRNGYDLTYEDVLRKTLEDSAPTGILVKMVYIFCDRNYEHISSSMVNHLRNGGIDTTKYLVYMPYARMASDMMEGY